MMNVKLTLVAALALAAMTSACSREATGQVAAVVNGEEITFQEINTELSGLQLPAGADKKVAQQAALQRIIERRLLAKAAIDDGLDKEQEYLLRERQIKDALLVQMLIEKVGRAVPIPGDSAIHGFIAKNPGAFANRAIYKTQQIRFSMPKNPKSLDALQSDHTLDAVAAHLTQLGIKYNRGEAELDSMQLPKPILDKMLALPQGEPFILPANGGVTVAVITGSRSAAVIGDDAKALAAQGLRNQNVADLIQQRLKAQRSQAKIEYQAGFAPASNQSAGK